MHLKQSTYGKGHVRIMRVKRDTDRHEVRELNVKVLLEGILPLLSPPATIPRSSPRIR